LPIRNLSSPFRIASERKADAMPRLRFTVRRMMIAVAIVAALLGWLGERRARFLRLSAHYGRLAKSYLDLQPDPQPGEYPDATGWRQIIWSWGLRSKYERAARYPWLPIAPDPPEPDGTTIVP